MTMTRPTLRSRIIDDAEFLRSIFANVQADKVLERIQERFPEADEYDANAQKIIFTAPEGYFRWLEYYGGDMKYCSLFVPSKEQDE